MKVLDLFSGVGMFAYGMEKAGHEVVAFCEIEEWPRRVLDKHWPDVPIYEDVRNVTAKRLEEDGVISDTDKGRLMASINTGERKAGMAEKQPARNLRNGKDGKTNRRSIDIITGGFPCQDLSVAGKQAGIKGERSGLFDEIIRLACELRPRYIVLENVAALLTGDSGGWARYVFGRLAEIGFDAEWHVIPAGGSNVSSGAPHRRERVWIVAYASSQGLQGCTSERVLPRRSPTGGHSGPSSPRIGGRERTGNTEPSMGLLADGIASRLAGSGWLPEPRVSRVAVGVPDRVHKLKALGNGLVWQIPYAIGRAINGD